MPSPTSPRNASTPDRAVPSPPNTVSAALACQTRPPAPPSNLTVQAVPPSSSPSAPPSEATAQTTPPSDAAGIPSTESAATTCSAPATTSAPAATATLTQAPSAPAHTESPTYKDTHIANAGSPARVHERPREDSTIVRKATAGLAANIVQLGASFITTCVLARNLAPSELGQYYLLFTIIILTSLLISCGIESANSVFVGRGQDSTGHIHTTSIILVIFMGATSIALGMLAYYIPALNLVGKVPLLSFQTAMGTVPFILYQNFLWAILIGTGHLVLMSRTKLLIAGIRLCGDLIAVYGGCGAQGLLLSFLICSAIGAGAIFVLTIPFAFPERLTNMTVFRELFAFGIKSHFGTIANQLHSRAGTLILNFYHGTAAVGCYSLGVQVAEWPLLFFGAVQNAIFSRVSGCDRAKATQTISFIIRLSIVAYVVLVGVGIACVPFLIVNFFGEQYANSGKAFAILIGGTAAIGMTRLLIPYFLGQLQRPGLLSAMSWVNVIVTLSSCFLLIPSMSVNGAAIASLVTYSLNLALMLISYWFLGDTNASNFMIPRWSDIRFVLRTLRRQRRAASPSASTRG